MMQYMIHRSRIAKTKYFLKDRMNFLVQMHREIQSWTRRVEAKGLRLAVRLNLTSDISWETFPILGGMNIMDLNPSVQFYDYTKSTDRVWKYIRGEQPDNYHLTFSLADVNAHVQSWANLLVKGCNVAIVFSQIPKSGCWHNWPLLNGDKYDHRFLDPKRHIVALTAKARAKKTASNFIVGLSV